MEKAFRSYFKDNILGDIDHVPEGKEVDDHYRFGLHSLALPWSLDSLERLIGGRKFYIRALEEKENSAGAFLYARIYFE